MSSEKAATCSGDRNDDAGKGEVLRRVRTHGPERSVTAGLPRALITAAAGYKLSRSDGDLSVRYVEVAVCHDVWWWWHLAPDVHHGTGDEELGQVLRRERRLG